MTQVLSLSERRRSMTQSVWLTRSAVPVRFRRLGRVITTDAADAAIPDLSWRGEQLPESEGNLLKFSDRGGRFSCCPQRNPRFLLPFVSGNVGRGVFLSYPEDVTTQPTPFPRLDRDGTNGKARNRQQHNYGVAHVFGKPQSYAQRKTNRHRSYHAQRSRRGD